jgi:pyruvate dehydrogenase E2 component (dihydrolipoamide acetyltransferase)
MAVPIKLPDMGTTVEECKVLTWRVKEGDAVKRGDVLAEIETDKAVAELESTAEGVLLRQIVNAGDMAHTGDVLAYIGKRGDTVPPETQGAPTPRATSPRGPVVAGVAPARSAGAGPVRVAPVVRNLAVKLNVDLASVQGTGAGGLITREDVLQASQRVPRPATASAAEGLPRAQAAVARAVQRSWKEIPHLYITAVLDMTAAERIRTEGELKGNRPSYDAIFLKAMALAAEAVPLVAAKLDGERVVRPQGIHIALAIGLGNELFLPVLRDVGKKDLVTLQAEIADLVSKVRNRSLRPDQMTGAGMALSNLGMYPIEDFQAIIFPEHSTILAVGSVQKKAVVRDGRVEIRPLATAKLAADHRLINGRTAAEFLSKLKEVIEFGDPL